MKLIVDCAQKLQQLGERVFNEKKQETYEPIDEPTIATDFTNEHGIPCPDGYIFKDENGNVINATKIVLDSKYNLTDYDNVPNMEVQIFKNGEWEYHSNPIED